MITVVYKLYCDACGAYGGEYNSDTRAALAWHDSILVEFDVDTLHMCPKCINELKANKDENVDKEAV